MTKYLETKRNSIEEAISSVVEKIEYVEYKFKNEKDAKFIFDKTGIKNFLIGESLLKSDKPEKLMREIIKIFQ